MSHLEQLTRRAPNSRNAEESAWDRYKAWIARRVGKNGKNLPPMPSRTELDVLVENHRFIREDADRAGASWEDRLALRWYDKLFREYALIDLKHYKTGDIALRWRTSDEVVARAGELTCGSLRCKYHQAEFDEPPSPAPSSRSRRRDDVEPEEAPLVRARLTTWQLPFAYEEAGEDKEALVKVVLCERCGKKLSYKSDKQREAGQSDRRRSASPERRHRDELDRRRD